MFDVDTFIEACRTALNDPTPHPAVKEVVERAVSEPDAVASVLGPFHEGGVHTLHRSDDLTVLNIVWPPYINLFPHDHRMWAVIGVYGGQEDNTFYRRREGGVGLDAINGQSLTSKDVIALGDKVVHSVKNPSRPLTAAIHVYGGDFFATARSGWEDEESAERPWDPDQLMLAFAEANERAKELREET